MPKLHNWPLKGSPVKGPWRNQVGAPNVGTLADPVSPGETQIVQLCQQLMEERWLLCAKLARRQIQAMQSLDLLVGRCHSAQSGA